MSFPEGFAGHGAKYHASKILAHQATLTWMSSHSPSFSLVTLHPSFVLGHSLVQTSAEDIGGINALFWGALQAPAPQFPALMVDVRDVADAQIKAAKVELEGGEWREFLISQHPMEWEDVVAFLRKQYPQVEVKWEPPYPKASDVDVSRAEQELGMRWRSMEEIFGSLVEQQLRFRNGESGRL